MNAPVTRQEALARLRGALAARKPGLVKMIEAGPLVRARFESIFRLENLPKLTEEDSEKLSHALSGNTQ